MKLLFDQNISFRISELIQDDFPNSSQVRLSGLENSSDKQIWEFAKKNSFTIVTFDSDFYDFSIIFKSPPKVIWLRIGNTSTKNIEKIIRDNKNTIKNFIEDLESDCLEIV